MKKWTIKDCTLSTAKSLIKMFKEDGYIDEDSHMQILYNDGTLLSYPDEAEKIKFRNIKNIHFMGSDDSRDFNYDDISTPETAEFIKATTKYPMKYENQLLVDDIETYYQKYFNN